MHVVGNTHLQQLRSARSAEDGDITSWGQASGINSIHVLAYPRLVNLQPSGDLGLFIRQCSPDEGANVVMIPYLAGEIDTWSKPNLRRIVVGCNEPNPGTPPPTGPDDCAPIADCPNTSDGRFATPYLADVVVGHSPDGVSPGTIHLSWHWLVNPGDGPGGSELPYYTYRPSYTYSEDGGTHWKWKNSDGVEQETEFLRFCGTDLSEPQGEEAIEDLVAGSDVYGRNGAIVDSGGRYHRTYVQDDALGVPELVRAYRDEDGWHPPVPLGLDVNAVAAAGDNALLEMGNRVYMLYGSRPATNSFDGDRTISLIDITPGEPVGVPFVIARLSQGSTSVDYDPVALSELGELHIFVSPMSSASQVFAGVAYPAEREFFSSENWTSQVGYVISLPVSMITELENGTEPLYGMAVVDSDSSSVPIPISGAQEIGGAGSSSVPIPISGAQEIGGAGSSTAPISRTFVRMSVTAGDAAAAQTGYVIEFSTSLVPALESGAQQIYGIKPVATQQSTTPTAISGPRDLGYTDAPLRAAGNTFVRMSVTAGDGAADGNELVLNMRVSETSSVDLGRLTFDGAVETKYTPWLPVPSYIIEGLENHITATLRAVPESGSTSGNVAAWTIQIGEFCGPPTGSWSVETFTTC